MAQAQMSRRTHALGAADDQSRSMKISALVPVAVLVLSTAACGEASPGASDVPRSTAGVTQTSTAGGSASPSPPASASPSRRPKDDKNHRDRITPAGVAAIVQEHLGAERIRRFGTYGDDLESVGVMVELRHDGRRDIFGVQVYRPQRGKGGLGEAATCPSGRRAKRIRAAETVCEKLPDGTSVMAQLVPHGFSDDNEDGLVISGVSARPDGTAAIAMYESYDSSPSITVAEVAELLSDPGLTWEPEPSVNEAGRDVDVRRLQG